MADEKPSRDVTINYLPLSIIYVLSKFNQAFMKNEIFSIHLKKVFLKVFLTKKNGKKIVQIFILYVTPYVCSDELTSFSRFFLWATDSHSSIFQDLCSQKISLKCIKICYIVYRKNVSIFQFLRFTLYFPLIDACIQLVIFVEHKSCNWEECMFVH